MHIKRHRKTNIGQAGLGLTSNGKGDKDRTTNRRAYEANYAEIDWRPRATMGTNNAALPRKVFATAYDPAKCKHGVLFTESCYACLGDGRMNSFSH